MLINVFTTLTEMPQRFMLETKMFLQLAATFLVIWILIWKWNRRHLEKLCGQLKTKLRALPLIGHLYLIFGNEEARMKGFQIAGRDAIEAGGTTALWQGYKLYLMIADPEVADVVLKNCLDKDDVYNKFHQVTGDGSIFTSVPIWRPRRKFLAPTFNMKNLNRFVEVFSAQSCVMVDKLKSLEGKSPSSMWTALSTYTMDAVCGTTLGFQAKAQENPDQPFLVALEEMFQIVAARMCQPWLYFDFIFKRLPLHKTIVKHKAFAYEFIDKIIRQKRRANKISQNHQNKGGLKPFIELMLETELDESDVAIREECLVIMGAATDSTAVGVGYALVMLARHPEVQDKVYQELKDVFIDIDRPVVADDLHRLKYLDAAIKETMRLYPPVPVIARKIENEVLLPSGVKLLPGIGAAINIWAIHRNPHYWGKDAELFRPERFFDSAPEHPAAFIPFSYGPRNCLGLQYATMSMKTALASLVKKYRIVPASPGELNQEPLRVKYNVMMRHIDNYCVGIEARK